MVAVLDAVMRFGSGKAGVLESTADKFFASRAQAGGMQRIYKTCVVNGGG